MKQLLFLMFLITPFLGYNQTVNGTKLEDIKVKYIEIVGTSKLLSNKLTIDIDFGQDVAFASSGKETILKDENDKKIVFNSMVDALNFFDKYGYEFASAYVISGSQSVYHWLLKKKDK